MHCIEIKLLLLVSSPFTGSLCVVRKRAGGMVLACDSAGVSFVDKTVHLDQYMCVFDSSIAVGHSIRLQIINMSKLQYGTLHTYPSRDWVRGQGMGLCVHVTTSFPKV